jgi:hypothetical protein
MIEQVELPPLMEAINLRAYEYFLERGCEHGHDLEDWLRAEVEVTRELGLSEEQEPSPESEAELSPAEALA